MNLVDKKVEHSQFGLGVISKQSEEKITVQFNTGEKKFLYPMAFEQFLVMTDEVLRAEIAQCIQSKKAEIENENNAKKEKEAELLAESIKVNKPTPTVKVKKVNKVNKLARIVEVENDENIILYKEK